MYIHRPADVLSSYAQVLQRFRIEYSGRPLRLTMQLNCMPDAPLQFGLVERDVTERATRRHQQGLEVAVAA